MSTKLIYKILLKISKVFKNQLLTEISIKIKKLNLFLTLFFKLSVMIASKHDKASTFSNYLFGIFFLML